MVKLTVNTDILWDGRLVQLAHVLDATYSKPWASWSRSGCAVGRTVATGVDRITWRHFLPAEYSSAATIERLLEVNFLRKAEDDPHAYVITDNCEWLVNMAKRSKAAAAGGRARAAQMIKPIAKVKGRAKKEAVTTPTLNQKTWTAYLVRYESRYGAKPQDNARSRSLIAQLGQRLGDDAPDVVGFFVAHNDRLYVRAMHALNLAVRDAEALRTQWATGRRMTDSQARQTDEGRALPISCNA